MPPQNNSHDLLGFDDFYSMPTLLGSKSMGNNVAPKSRPGHQNRVTNNCAYYAKVNQIQSQKQQPQYRTQPAAPSMNKFSCMEMPVPSMVTVNTSAEIEPMAIEQCFTSPEYLMYEKTQEAAPWDIQQCYTTPDLEPENPPAQEASPWDIQQCYTAPDLESENQFGVFGYAPVPNPASPDRQDLVQSPTRESMYRGNGSHVAPHSNTRVEMLGLVPPKSSFAAPPRAINHQKSSLIKVTKVQLASPTSSPARQTYLQYDMEVNNNSRSTASTSNNHAATERLYPWTEQSRPNTARHQYSFEDEGNIDMTTYRRGMKGNHGQKRKGGRPEQKCKGLRALFGTPKELNKRTKADPTVAKVVMNPSISKSLAKGSLVKLVGSPKPLQKRPQDVANNLFV